MADLPPFPPSQVPFGELDYGDGAFSQTPPFSAIRTAEPYDLVEDLPGYRHNRLGWQTTRARGGACHYASEIATTLEATVPPIDRAFYFKVDDEEVGLYGFWGPELNPGYSFVVRTKSTESKMTLFDQNQSTIYIEALVRSGNSSIWGYTQDQSLNYKLLADNNKAALYAWNADDSNYITISTEHFPQDQSLVVQLREMDTCEKDAQGNPLKILVLCSQPYSDP